MGDNSFNDATEEVGENPGPGATAESATAHAVSVVHNGALSGSTESLYPSTANLSHYRNDFICRNKSRSTAANRRSERYTARQSNSTTIDSRTSEGLTGLSSTTRYTIKPRRITEHWKAS
eukprot:IDg13520t1